METGGIKGLAVGVVGLAFGILFLGGILFLIIWGWNAIKVYSATQTGKAEYAQAESNRQIKVLEAQALYDAAELTANAEIRRAQGVAEANRIVAEGLGGPEGYLRYLYIDMLRDNEGVQTIYVPTEAGLPILEAGKR